MTRFDTLRTLAESPPIDKVRELVNAITTRTPIQVTVTEIYPGFRIGYARDASGERVLFNDGIEVGYEQLRVGDKLMAVIDERMCIVKASKA